MLKIRLVGCGLIVGNMSVNKQHVAKSEPLFVMPVHILKHGPPAGVFEVAVERKIIGQNRPAGFHDLRDDFII